MAQEGRALSCTPVNTTWELLQPQVRCLSNANGYILQSVCQESLLANWTYKRGKLFSYVENN